MKFLRYFSAAALALLVQTASAQLSEHDRNEPWGWCNSTSLTSGDTYKVTGGGASTSSNTITLKNDGSDMASKIKDAINKYSVVILDGSAGDFTIGQSMTFSSVKNKTIVGINGARLCTKFFLTKEIHDLLDAAGVKKASSSEGTGDTLPNDVYVKEQREYLTRKTLMKHFNLSTKEDEYLYIRAGIFTFDKCENLIIRNLDLVGPGPCDVGGYDLLSATGTKHMWVDHCDFTDGIDGNFDITKSSDFNSVTWCTFSYTDRAYDHMNSNLIGSSDDEPADNLNTTMAFCVWGNKCNQRMPMARAGTIHLVNNYYNCPGNSVAVNPRKNSEFLIEGCYFAKNVKAFSQTSAISYVFNDCYWEGKSLPASKGKTVISYEYDEPLSVKDVPAVLTAANGAGATLAKPLVIGKSTEAETGPSTSIIDLSPAGTPVSVLYHNILGMKSNAPFKGINIVVSTYADGSKSTKKVIF